MNRLLNSGATFVSLVLSMTGGAFATCTISPAEIVVIQGQTKHLTVTCDAGERFSSIDWLRDTTSASSGAGFAISNTESGPFSYRVWDRLQPGVYFYKMTGVLSPVPTPPTPATLESTSARVVVIGSPVATNNGACGSANGVLAHSTPAAQLCSSGTPSPATPTVGADAYSWSCVGSGTDATTAACRAPRGYNVAATISGGAMLPVAGTYLVPYRGTKTFSSLTAGTPGESPVVSGTCGGVFSNYAAGTGNASYTTQPIVADCTVAVSFTNIVVGQCGADNNQLKTATPTSLCAAGNPSAVTETLAKYTWSCAGSGGGTSASCQATHGYTVTTTAGAGGTISPSKTVAYNTPTTLTVTPNSGFNASVTGTCGGSPATGSAAFTYTTNAIVANCSVSATFTSGSPSTDPGSGLWIPPGYPNLLVADQMAVNGAGDMNYIPGCINHEPTPTSSSGGCAANDYYYGAIAGGGTTTFQFLQGNILSIRVTGKDDGFPDSGYFQLKGATGNNLNSSVSIWVVTDPRTSYADASANCKATDIGQINILTTTGMCQLTPGTHYYVNIMVNDANHCGLATQCRMQLIESTDSF